MTLSTEALFNLDACLPAAEAIWYPPHPVTGEPITAWPWRLAGPGHEKTHAVAETLFQEAMTKVTNTEDVPTLASLYRDKLKVLVPRIIDFPPCTFQGQRYEFSEDAATELLTHPGMLPVYLAFAAFMADDSNWPAAGASNDKKGAPAGDQDTSTAGTDSKAAA